MTEPNFRALCAELVDYLDCFGSTFNIPIGSPLVDRTRDALNKQPDAIGPEWRPCVKLPITVHVREQRPGETHSSTREGLTPLLPDDLIMRGVQGEEYPIGRELFEQTYRLEE
jgi:hypothetical protein